MNEYIIELYEQWANGNRNSVCQGILAKPNPAVTAVYFTQHLIANDGLAEASIFACLLESQTS